MSNFDQLIFNNFNKHISLSEAEQSYVLTLLKEKMVLKKDCILQQGGRCNKIYFVESGSMRAYNINEDGKESTIMFALSDWWITDMGSFVNQQSSDLTIVALEDSKLIELEYSNLQLLYKELPVFERFFRILFQNAYIREQRRAFYNISMSTEERYFQFMNKYPEMVMKITQKQIASYLGVTPEFLSSIKKKADS